MKLSPGQRCRRSQASRIAERRRLVAMTGAAAALAVLAGACIVIALAVRRPAASSAAQPSLRVAYSPESQALLGELLAEFNKTHPKSSSGKAIQIELVPTWPDQMARSAVAGEVQAVCPDSSIWLGDIDAAWSEQAGNTGPLVGETVRFAISPVVIAMRQEVAGSLGYPGKRIGWTDIIDRARSDSQFSWSHPSTSSASGLLATLAEFYAGAGKTRGLTVEDATAEATLKYVAAVEATVKHYGEGELATVEQQLAGGDQRLDAFVVQEQLVVYYNSRSEDKLVAVYPAEGTLWEDHPLALLELPGLSPEAREAFAAFAAFLKGDQAQAIVLHQGYRPADLSIPLDSQGSPLVAANGVDPRQPETVLQVPSSAVINVVRDVWWYTKRHTNVILVADTSGSMDGSKLEAARQALAAFLDSIKGDQERVGLVEFSTSIVRVIPLAELSQNRQALQVAIQDMEAGGDTALLDAVSNAYSQLQELGDQERINAIVVMTDGRENASRTRLSQLVTRIKDGNSRGVPIVIFCIAYGHDADRNVLSTIAKASGGQVRGGDVGSIQDLYKIISTYF